MTRPANRIVCIGNALIEQDAAGPRTYEELARRELPGGLVAIDGGLGGLNLLWALDGASRVVFVDAVLDAAPASGLKTARADLTAAPATVSYGHAAGLDYLLRAWSALPHDTAPDVFVIGVPAGAGAELIASAADLSIALASGAAS